MTLLNPAYASEIFHPITASGLPVTHILLHADTPDLVEPAVSDGPPGGPGSGARDDAVRLGGRRAFLRGGTLLWE
jgi:hypothetical protein